MRLSEAAAPARSPTEPAALCQAHPMEASLVVRSDLMLGSVGGKAGHVLGVLGRKLLSLARVWAAGCPQFQGTQSRWAED